MRFKTGQVLWECRLSSKGVNLQRWTVININPGFPGFADISKVADDGQVEMFNTTVPLNEKGSPVLGRDVYRKTLLAACICSRNAAQKELIVLEKIREKHSAICCIYFDRRRRGLYDEVSSGLDRSIEAVEAEIGYADKKIEELSVSESQGDLFAECGVE
jgi:hypothetical protein